MFVNVEEGMELGSYTLLPDMPYGMYMDNFAMILYFYGNSYIVCCHF